MNLCHSLIFAPCHEKQHPCFATPLLRECDFLVDIDAFSLAALTRCLLTLQFQFLCGALFKIFANRDANIIVHVPLGTNRYL